MHKVRRKTGLILSIVAGAFVFAGICSDGRDAWAQTPVSIQAQEACPLPEGVAPPRGPIGYGTTRGRRQRHPAGIRSGRDLAFHERRFRRSNATAACVLGMPTSAGRRPVAFRVHVPRYADSGRASISARQEHVPFGRSAAIFHLRADSLGARHPCGGSARSGFHG